MNYLRQIIYEMRHQKMMTWVSISGTALSMFLVMALFMANQLMTVEAAPETNRKSIYIGQNIHLTGGTWGDSSGAAHYETIKQIYGNLKSIETASYMSQWADNADINVKGGDTFTVLPKWVDWNFWKIYDFRFLDGKPFNEADCNSGAKKIVLTRSLARSLFGEENVSGREVLVDAMPYVVAGVVEDVSPLLNTTFANFYLVFTPEIGKNGNDKYFGNTQVALLLKDGVSFEELQNEVKSRYATVGNEVAKEGAELVYHEQPYNAEIISDGGYGSNNSPDVESSRRGRLVIYAILILLPAINLSSMTRSRLRHRVSEIGVRRAFGAKKSSILGQMMGENMIITFIGGVIGLLLSVLFVLFASNLFFQYSGGLSVTSLDIINAKPTFGMLFTWENFVVAFVLCLILNILSATVPAWQASRVEPAVAIAKVK